MTLDLVVHATHEAGAKIGGIGAVLAGILGTRAWAGGVRRTVLAGALQPGLALDPGWRPAELPAAARRALAEVERRWGVRIAAGRRRLGGVEHELLLVDVSGMGAGARALAKYRFWEASGVDSRRFEHEPEYDREVLAAAPLLDAVDALAAGAGPRRLVVAHEWMGVPLALLARASGRWRAVLHAHEVPAARVEVEGHPGHDLRFYSALRLAGGRTFAELFGDPSGQFRQALVEAAGARVDAVLAVGDPVAAELRSLGGPLARRAVEVVPNGLPPAPARPGARRRLLDAAEALAGMRPSHVFTHVSRFVVSKAAWRDVRVLEALDPLLSAEGRSAVLLVLSTERPGGHPPELARRWAAGWGWPRHHRDEDLGPHEAAFWWGAAEPLNRRARAVRVVLVNQFGWSRAACGPALPEDADFADLRAGTDLEFGQSVYEPFGIAQVEPLAAGALSVVSDACGCAPAVRAAAADVDGFDALLVGDYGRPPEAWGWRHPEQALAADRAARDVVERLRADALARAVARLLPRTEADRRRRAERGAEVARRLGWERVVADHLLPALERAAGG